MYTSESRNVAAQIRGGDALPHDAGTDHRDRLNRPRWHVGLIDAGVFLVAVREEEDVDERSIDRRAEQRRHPLGFFFASRINVGHRCAEHDFERRQRGRVMPFRLLLDQS